MPSSLAKSTSFAPDAPLARSVLGRTEPRIWTRPLRELTPDTSYGFDVAEFARDTLNHPFDPWQEWLAIHGGELLPDGLPRFHTVLVLVARQNGKTETPVVLSLYWQFIECVPMVLGTSTKLDYAKESWVKACRLAESAADLDDLRPSPWKREGKGDEESWTREGSRYKIAASNAEGGRSLTIHRLVLDELREHHDYSAWSAAEPATSAVAGSQIWALSNAGDARSVVLNDLLAAALEYIETGQGDPGLGLFAWCAPDDADPRDVHALAMANPNLNRRIPGERLLRKAERAVKLGGEALTSFKTEYMCITVKLLNPAVDPSAWRDRLELGGLDDVRSRVAACIDVAPDQRHATLYAAAVLADGRTRIEPVQAWTGQRCTDDLWEALPELLTRVNPRVFGWLPAGPAAALAANLAARKGRAGWPPAGVTVAEIKSELAAVCMGFVQLVDTGKLVHSGDPLINAQIASTERLKRGDTWVFSRRGDGHCDAVYAAAAAAWLARTMPPPAPRPRIIYGGRRPGRTGQPQVRALHP